MDELPSHGSEFKPTNHVNTRTIKMSKTAGSPWKRREVALLVVGVVLGQCLYHSLLVLMHGGQHVVCKLPVEVKADIAQHNVAGNSVEDLATSNLLFVGVMTSRRYLRTRAKAIYDTWGSLLNGSIVFFVGEGDNIDDDLPVEILHDVTDTEYPPQRKSFAMLDFMYRKFGHRFSWFMRADDDLFVDVNRLKTLLRSLDGSFSWYLGHPGTGRPEEVGQLGLPLGSAYCMGGTGVLLSRDVLGALSGRLKGCLEKSVTDHEDSELGRCVYNVTGLACSNTPSVYRLFKQNYDDTTGAWLQRAFRSPRPYVTFHPVKDTRYMYLGSALLDARRVSCLQGKIRELSAAMTCIDMHVRHTCEDSVTADRNTDSLCAGSITTISDCDFRSTRRTKSNVNQFQDTPWSLVTRNVLYGLSRGTLRKPVDYAGVSVGLNNVLTRLAHHVKTEQPGAGQLRVVWSDNHYRRLVPAVGVEYVTFVRLGSSRLRPYIIKQEFEELQLV
ncbi:hypothetical protein BaRGS_00016279 [Batillaria attramentaria]|uniref:N-acetylgalactosaminide beta-1,3-galactosyltransferase n=1 Tax=Batillaria attramentaria TaxID=370345 RepID=A0ABD0KZ65_9CAEN